MRRLLLLSALFLVAVFVFVAASRFARANRIPLDDSQETILVDGLTRGYILHLPAHVDPARPIPLVLVFHGGGGHARNMPHHTHFDEIADQESFAVAYPDGYNKQWNDSREISPVDDVAFIRALIARLEHDHPIDPSRVYATGLSNGGFFSNRLACDLTDKIAAVASVAATMPSTLPQDCKPSRPISVLYMHGTKDPVVPINGGEIASIVGGLGENISLAAATRFWCGFDHTRPTPVSETLPGRVQDGTHIYRDVWAGGLDHTEVVVYTVVGGGHGWPGGPQYLPKMIVGKVSSQIDASRVIWNFFRDQHLP
ncbi:MAG TPA: PHB depolymerase family esterase [Terriglobales bacterium]|nr:PHB depolymerase family esterase [Terriglobales bacterium]